MVVGAGALVAVLAINQSSAQNLADTVNRLQANTAMATLPPWARVRPPTR